MHKRHRRVLIDKFRIEKHGVPSYSTIRRILIGVDFDILAKIFNQWTQNYVHVETSEWFGIDGKSIKETVQDYKNEYQNFVSIVSVFTEKRGIVLSLSKLENKQGSEISTVQNLIALLDIEGVVFSLDALHCQKKRGLLIIDSGNDYGMVAPRTAAGIAVKANQKNLYHQIRHNTENSKPTSRYITAEKTRNRVTTRTIEVFHDLTGISPEWAGLESLIKVERIGTRAGKPYHQVAYYISSLVRSATDFAKGIRGHWGIENRLHWVKDVIFDEDHSTIRMGNAPANLSVMRT